MEYATRQCSRVALFLLKRGKAVGWLAQSAGAAVPGFHLLELPLSEAPLFARAAEHRSCLLGFGGSPEIARVRDVLGGGGPDEILVVPLVIRGSTVALLVLQGPPGVLGPKALELHRLMEKAALAFEILILKSKILMT
ncbi:GAF domain-containing protein [Geomesophilobacter sediminis]|uniref:GAF domain-containing protein n=1 Tax=Geomesophilobacter sediminis TaxID=2798584 RepID=A0A8J7JEI6_9BACT|nr:GAF domain-containing protein [Geomesophilobacter sediminis]MBJ6725676.1 GAF domain-containing protein [Geomesophilobacter sediminis]